MRRVSLALQEGSLTLTASTAAELSAEFAHRLPAPSRHRPPQCDSPPRFIQHVAARRGQT